MAFSRLNQRNLMGFCLLLLTFSLHAAPLEIKVGSVTARVEVASTPRLRGRGLMFRSALEKDSGMLFVFPQQRTQHIWMRNTLIALDVGFFDRDGVLLNVITMQPDQGKQIHSSASPAIYALEMNPRWFERHGLSAGDRLLLPYKIKAE